jgi:hypothetical protein
MNRQKLLPLSFFFWFALFAGIVAPSRLYGDSQVSASVLASGKWYKIRITKTGIYKLTYEDLRSMGFTDPSGVRIYGNGGDMLPLMNNLPRPSDLTENSIYMADGGDGQFSAGDYILFYGIGPVTWKYNASGALFEHTVNGYSDASYYFVTTAAGSGKRVEDVPEVAADADRFTTSYDSYDYHERNKYNFLKSGRQWFGERFDYSVFDTTFTFTGLLTEEPVKLKANVLSRSSNTKAFVLTSGSTTVGTVAVAGVILNNSTGVYANQKSATFTFTAGGDAVNVHIDYARTLSSDEGYLDYLTLNARSNLSKTGNVLFFRDTRMTGAGHVARYVLGNCSAATQIWDITDIGSVLRLPGQLENTTLTFRDKTDILREYAAVDPSGEFPKPVLTGTDVGPVANQDLHGTGPCRMLIVTHPLFLEAADSIAEFHRNHDGMTVVVANVNEVYNEFSSGAPDVAAIRDFARMIHDRATGDGDRLAYLLLLGDGSYNNRSKASGNSNYIPTYQSESSLNASTSYVSDDFFGFMGATEGGSETMEAFSLDLGVGRLPAKTAEEALTLYRKIKNYNRSGNQADWRNNILFVGDDEDGNIHMTQANGLADWVRTTYPQFVVKKVLLDAYKQVATSSGARYPEVNRIITDNIQKGILIYNYTGHGGERGMAAEQILMRDDLLKLSNANHLPLFVTATCEFSRFDDLTDDEGKLIESTSAGETSLLNENGGSIALLSTTRIVYSDRNHYLNTKFYKVAFQRDAEGKYYRLGDIIKMTKDSTGVQRNKLNFILLGDPALTLALPEYRVVTDSLNQGAVSVTADTLKAFSRVTISGHLAGSGNELMDSFNGVIYPSVFDKNLTVTTLANDGGDPMQFTTQENLLFKGKASVTNGRFSFSFTVPKDITYSYGSGKITYYAADAAADANGYFDGFTIGGTSEQAETDSDGPDIALYLNDRYFADRGISNTDPVIYAVISDASGINTVGNGIGHDITGVLDDRVSEPIVLNDYFVTELDDFTRGSLSYPMTALDAGWHTLRVKVWDVFNNSSENTIAFEVIDSDRPVIEKTQNYPNPAVTQTWFRFEHNMPGTTLKLTVTVFDLSGRQVTVLKQDLTTGGFSTEPLEWDLKDGSGTPIAPGIYPYRVQITNEAGQSAESFSKLAVTRQ